MTPGQKDERYMRRALQLARRGMGATSPNPMVGAVIVRAGRIIAEGWHHKFGADHAEIDALKRASGSLRGATIYVTLEPCCHWGKTPPCVDTLIEQGIKRAVIATLDPNPRVDGKGVQALKEHGIELTTGILEQAARQLNEVYFHYIRTALPFITVKYAQSLDGRLATVQGNSRWISSEPARKFTHRLRAQHDAIMIGRGTVLADDPLLTVRLAKGKNPVRIVLDSNLQVPLDAQLLRDEEKTLIITTDEHGKDKIEKIRRLGKEVLVVQSGMNGRVDLKSLMKILADQGIASILVEGGAEVLTSLLREGLVNRMVVICAPLILGKGIQAIGDIGVTDLAKAIRPSSCEIKRIGEDVVFDLRL